METLNSILKKRKQTLRTGQWFSRSEIETKRKQDYFTKQKQLEQAQLSKHLEKLKQKEHFHTTNYLHKITGTKKQEDVNEKPEEKKQEEKKKPTDIKEIPMKRPEIISRLRKIEEPVTLFGENDLERYKRMLKFEEEYKKKKQGNTFVEDMELTKEDFEKKYQSGSDKITPEEFNKTFGKRKNYNLRLVNL